MQLTAAGERNSTSHMIQELQQVSAFVLYLHRERDEDKIFLRGIRGRKACKQVSSSKQEKKMEFFSKLSLTFSTNFLPSTKFPPCT